MSTAYDKKNSDVVPFSIVRPNSPQPTVEAYTDILNGFHHFNARLFEGVLSEPLITLVKKPSMIGAFIANRYRSRAGDNAHEILLNPQYLAQRTDLDSLSTLVHEMAHQWREDFGPERRGKSRGYHDAAWADCMERVGLMPSDTGKPEGNRTGQGVSHYIIEGGVFSIAAQELLDRGYVIRWAHRLNEVEREKIGDGETVIAPKSPAKPKKKDRIAFTCPNAACGQNAWAKPNAQLKCAPCDAILIPKPQKDTSNEAPV